LVAARVLKTAPSLWQIELGVLRMWHRLLFRPDTVGCCEQHPVRPNLRARLLQFRLLRFPFLLRERAIAPLDMSGLCQPTWRLIRHLLGAHHDAHQFAYDLEILKGSPGALGELRDRAAAIVSGSDPRAAWLRDLCVFERYHENLLAAAERALVGQPLVGDDEADDPDITFSAYIRWCLAQPEDPPATWRAWRQGEFPRPLAAPNPIPPGECR
jgi:hypothetical protein